MINVHPYYKAIVFENNVSQSPHLLLWSNKWTFSRHGNLVLLQNYLLGPNLKVQLEFVAFLVLQNKCLKKSLKFPSISMFDPNSTRVLFLHILLQLTCSL